MEAIITLNEQLRTWSPTEPGSTEPGWRAKPLGVRRVLWRSRASSFLNIPASQVGSSGPTQLCSLGLGSQRERGRVLGTKQSGCDLWVQILLHIPRISLFWPWPLAQGDLLFLINMLIKSLLSPCCVQGTAKTHLFLVYPGHKIKDGNHFSFFPTSLACWYVRVLYWWDSSAMFPFPERQCR